jgi:hypothetical protein
MAETVPEAANNDAAAATSSGAEEAPTANGAAAAGSVSETEAAKNAPKWAKEAHTTLFGGDLGMDDAWKVTAGLWWVLETSTGFASPVSPFCLGDDVAI